MFRTMLVEDNPTFRELVKLYLQSQFPSMNILEAKEGTEALEKIDSFPPNLIFMDIRLPGQNGLELTKKIKTEHSDITIVILTSYNLPEYREAATQYKADYFLLKDSIATGELDSLVKSVLSQKRFNPDGSSDG